MTPRFVEEVRFVVKALRALSDLLSSCEHSPTIGLLVAEKQVVTARADVKRGVATLALMVEEQQGPWPPFLLSRLYLRIQLGLTTREEEEQGAQMLEQWVTKLSGEFPS